MTRARLISFAAVLALCGGLAAADDIPVRIITFNTEEGIADTAARREASGNQLTTLDFDGAGPNTALMPDILCLQETRSDSQLLSFRDDYLPGYSVWRGNQHDSGGNTQAVIFAPYLTLLQATEWNHGGPRWHHRMVFQVDGSDEILVVYNAHFKAFGDSGSVATRREEANNLANRVALDWANGVDITYDGVPDLPMNYYVVTGDLNQSDFSSDVIDSLIIGGDNGLDTGLNDVRVESILGAQVGGAFIGGTQNTRFGLENRLDYVLACDAIFEEFDTNQDGTWWQSELNNAGFVYFSGDDGGQRASGDTDATSVASDHAPVVVNFTIPASGGIPGDIDGDGDVDQADLGALLSAYGSSDGDPNWNPDADLDGDGDVDQADLGILLSNYGIGI